MLNKIFKSKNKISTGKTIDMKNHSSWGDSISFFDFDDREIVGHMTPRPNVGDILLCPMREGGIAKFEIISMEYRRDPCDMFFGKVKDLGCVEEESVSDKEK